MNKDWAVQKAERSIPSRVDNQYKGPRQEYAQLIGEIARGHVAEIERKRD